MIKYYIESESNCKVFGMVDTNVCNSDGSYMAVIVEIDTDKDFCYLDARIGADRITKEKFFALNEITKEMFEKAHNFVTKIYADAVQLQANFN